MRAPALALAALTLAACGGRSGLRDLGDGGAAPTDAVVHDAPVVHGDAGAHCDKLAERYLSVAYGLNYCTRDSDCTVIDPVCSITRYAGLDVCYLYVNAQADRAELAELEQNWVAAICPINWCGDCGPPPQLACRDGACVPGGGTCEGPCVSGPDTCCGRDCDPATTQMCNTVCPPAPPADPLCECRGDHCAEVRCDQGCPPGSTCDGQRCVRTPRCETNPFTGCVPFLDHCTCEWSCIDGDSYPVDCPAVCADEDKLRLEAPLCDCGAGGCGMRTCGADGGDCGWGYLCQDIPGSLGYPVCVECPNC